jgi:hypothetical protein
MWDWKKGFFGALLAMLASEAVPQRKPLVFQLAESEPAPAPKKDKERESLVIKRARQRKAKRGF